MPQGGSSGCGRSGSATRPRGGQFLGIHVLGAELRALLPGPGRAHRGRVRPRARPRRDAPGVSLRGPWHDIGSVASYLGPTGLAREARPPRVDRARRPRGRRRHARSQRRRRGRRRDRERDPRGVRRLATGARHGAARPTRRHCLTKNQASAAARIPSQHQRPEDAHDEPRRALRRHHRRRRRGEAREQVGRGPREGDAQPARGEKALRRLEELRVLRRVERRALLEALAADRVDVIEGPQLRRAVALFDVTHDERRQVRLRRHEPQVLHRLHAAPGRGALGRRHVGRQSVTDRRGGGPPCCGSSRPGRSPAPRTASAASSRRIAHPSSVAATVTPDAKRAAVPSLRGGSGR